MHDSIRTVGTAHRIDPDRWRPLIMAFQRFYGIGSEVQPSRLAGIDDKWYRETASAGHAGARPSRPERTTR